MSNTTLHNNKWLVLGASGQLGREWCFYLEQEGIDYHGLTRDQLDITRPRQIRKTLDNLVPDVIVNCSAYTHVDKAEDERVRAEQVNAVAVGELAKISADRNILLIHYSTDYVFPGALKHRKLYPDGYPETCPADPVNWYGHTKWQGEEAVRRASGRHLIIRVSWLCGRVGNNFVHTMLQLSRERDHVKVVDDQLGCPSFTRPVVINTRALVEYFMNGQETIHVSSQGETSWYEFARTIFRLAGKEMAVEAIPSSAWPTRAKRPEWSRLNIKRLSEIPGTRILPWQEELEKLLLAHKPV
ncbi:MAG: dTDP-4-dehydrorhamnose reductase [Balneolales bacterium]